MGKSTLAKARAKTAKPNSPRHANRDKRVDDRPVVTITTEEHAVNDEAVKALANDADLYQRGGLLVRLVNDVTGCRIDALSGPTLRERLTQVATWESVRVNTEGVETRKPEHPPDWCVRAVHSRGQWAGVRQLEAVVEYPVLSPVGSIHYTAGFDPATRLFVAPTGPVDAVAHCPTAEDVRDAVAALTEVVIDFPFEADANRAAWVAGLLTPLARFAFDGPAPMFLADANVRAAGKTMLVDLIGYITTGKTMTVSTFTADKDEMRKRITSHAIDGDRLVLFDNLSGFIRNPTLDAALTSTAWKDRILGVNRTVAAPLLMTWYASGNNVELYTDTARRTCSIRLESPEEKPEMRKGFRHPDLIRWVKANRPRLLAAALTILRAYCAAGRPDPKLPPWGSFDGWSDLVRGAVVWAGMADPGDARQSIVNNDPITDALGILMRTWEQADPSHRGLTAGEFMAMLKDAQPAPSWAADANAALDALLDRRDARGLGNRLKSYRRRNIGGRIFDHAGNKQNAVRWTVYPATVLRSNKTHNTNESNGGAADPGGCRESCESVFGPLDDTDRGVIDFEWGPQ